MLANPNRQREQLLALVVFGGIGGCTQPFGPGDRSGLVALRQLCGEQVYRLLFFCKGIRKGGKLGHLIVSLDHFIGKNTLEDDPVIFPADQPQKGLHTQRRGCHHNGCKNGGNGDQNTYRPGESFRVVGLNGRCFRKLVRQSYLQLFPGRIGVIVFHDRCTGLQFQQAGLQPIGVHSLSRRRSHDGFDLLQDLQIGRVKGFCHVRYLLCIIHA